MSIKSKAITISRSLIAWTHFLVFFPFRYISFSLFFSSLLLWQWLYNALLIFLNTPAIKATGPSLQTNTVAQQPFKRASGGVFIAALSMPACCKSAEMQSKFSIRADQITNVIRDDKIDDFLSSTVALSLASIVSHNIFHQGRNTYFRPPFWVFLGGQSIRARIPWDKKPLYKHLGKSVAMLSANVCSKEYITVLILQFMH